MNNRMKLSDFVATTLSEIIEGVAQSQIFAKDHGAEVNPRGVSSNLPRLQTNNTTALTQVDFDITLTVGQDDKEQGGFGIFAAAFASGVKGENRDYSENANRVKFQVVVQLPEQK